MTQSGHLPSETKTLKSTNWKDIVELVGIAAIVASLIFVGLQMQQSQEIAIAAQYHDRAALAIEINNSQLESGNLRAWGILTGKFGAPMSKLLEEQANWSVEEWGGVLIYGISTAIQFDNHYFQYESGFMNEGAWQAYRQLLKYQLTIPDSPINVALATFGKSYRESFVELCEQLRAEANAELGENLFKE